MTLRALALLLFLVPEAALAQDSIRVDLARPAPRARLGLAEALSQARVSNPGYRRAQNAADPARWAVKNAYGALLPELRSNGTFGYTGSGASSFGGATFSQTSPALTSSYNLSLGMTLSGRTLSGPATQKANERAVTEDISASGMSLNNDITLQYLTTLQAAATTEVARQQVLRNDEFLTLARARQQLGQATLLDVRQAQVTRGRSEVEFLRARQSEQEAILELYRRMGVPLPVPVNTIVLSDSFPVTAPSFDLGNLIRMAEGENPVLKAFRARESAAGYQVKAAKSDYLPALNLAAGWSGFTQDFTNTGLLIDQATGQAVQNLSQCNFQNALIGALPGGGIPGYPNMGKVADCKNFSGLDATGDVLLPEISNSIISRNSNWPFGFTTQPFRASVSISLPIFIGFGRNLQVSRANAAQADAEEFVRASELQVRAEVEGRHLALTAAFQAIEVEEANRLAAREQLTLAQERFRLGSGRALDVTDAQNAVTQAEASYVNAIYAYHKSIAALEFAVGRPLR